jgi:MarR family transcriptional regulator, transcriptional regulator for hemolysin
MLMKYEGVFKLGFLIHSAGRLLRKRFEERASGHGLSAAQWRLLFRLMKEEGVAQAKLAEFLEIEPISVSRLLDRMEEGGWIERQPSPQDRRVRMVFPSAKARALYDSIQDVVAEVYEEALDGVSDADRAALSRALERLVTNLSDGELPWAAQEVKKEAVQ